MYKASSVDKSSFMVITNFFYINNNYLNKIDEKARNQYVEEYISQVFYTNRQAYRTE